MNSWVSAKDHDLLLPSSKPDTLSGDAARGRADPASSLELGPAGPQSDALLPAGDASALAELKQEPNPYLADLEAPPAAQARAFSPSEPPAFAPADTIEPIRPADVSGFETKGSDTAHSFIPDFAQPSDDDKYFRQLKRF